MKAILVRYLPATNRKPSRWVATAEGGHRVVISYDHGDDADGNASAAAVALCQKLDWSGELVEGGLPNGDRVFCFAQSNSPLRTAAARLLAKLDHMTSDDFALGGEREEREILRTLLGKV